MAKSLRKSCRGRGRRFRRRLRRRLRRRRIIRWGDTLLEYIGLSNLVVHGVM